MNVIVGLGNPGTKYEGTRHNVGFFLLDAWVAHCVESGWSVKEKNTRAFVMRTLIDPEGARRACCVWPLAFMNRSGEALQGLIRDGTLTAKNLIVVHDEIDHLFGRFTIELGRSSAGHKGVENIIAHLGTKAFVRIRVGIASIDRRMPTEMYVLKKFTKVERGLLKHVAQQVCAALDALLNMPLERVQQHFHTKK